MYYQTRSKFSEDDHRYIATTLAKNEREITALHKVVTDPGSISELLHDRRLFDRLLEIPPLLMSVSPHLFFYLFAYRALHAKGIANDDLADYIAALCTEFRSTDALWQAMTTPEGEMIYFVDLLNMMNELDQAQQFQLHRYIGNVTLFLTGFFPDFLYHRSKAKGAPGLAYYESVGRTSYDAAAMGASRFEADAAPVLMTLAEQFVVIRTAMNIFTDAYLNLSNEKFSLTRLERQAATMDEKDFLRAIQNSESRMQNKEKKREGNNLDS